MSRSGNLPKLAADVERSNHVAGHVEHRRYLDALRLVCLDLATMAASDASHAGDWLYQRNPPPGRVGWFSRLFLSWRITGLGKNLHDALLEAAQTTVRMGIVHQEYITIEQAPVASSQRYRTGG